MNLISWLLYETREDSVISLKKLENRDICLNDVVSLARPGAMGVDPQPKKITWIEASNFDYVFHRHEADTPYAEVHFHRKISYKPVDPGAVALSFLAGTRRLGVGTLRTRKKRNIMASVSLFTGAVAILASTASIYFGYQTLAGNRPYFSVTSELRLNDPNGSPKTPLVFTTITNAGKRPATEASVDIFLINDSGTEIVAQSSWNLVNDIPEGIPLNWMENRLITDGNVSKKLFLIHAKYKDPVLSKLYEQTFAFNTSPQAHGDTIQLYAATPDEKNLMINLLKLKGHSF